MRKERGSAWLCQCAVCGRVVGAINRNRYVVARRHINAATKKPCEGWGSLGRKFTKAGRPFQSLRDDLSAKEPDRSKRWDSMKERRKRLVARWIRKFGLLGYLEVMHGGLALYNTETDKASMFHDPTLTGHNRFGDEHCFDAEQLLEILRERSKADAMHRLFTSHPELLKPLALAYYDVVPKPQKKPEDE